MENSCYATHIYTPKGAMVASAKKKYHPKIEAYEPLEKLWLSQFLCHFLRFGDPHKFTYSLE